VVSTFESGCHEQQFEFMFAKREQDVVRMHWKRIVSIGGGTGTSFKPSNQVLHYIGTLELSTNAPIVR